MNCVEEDLMILPGVGATMSNGRDSYPYYVSEVLKNGVIGMYHPSWSFGSGGWTSGMGVVEKFDETRPTEFFIKRRFGNWWKVDKNGKALEKWTGRYSRLKFGRACAYQDPSF